MVNINYNYCIYSNHLIPGLLGYVGNANKNVIVALQVGGNNAHA